MPQILFQGHAYNRQYQSPNLWRCSRKSKCNGMAKYLNGVFVQTQPHDCRPNVGAQKAKIAMDAIKGDAETSVLRTGEIVNNNLQNLDNGNNSIILYGHFETI